MASLKFVSKGAYGCVFTPPLPCEGETPRRANPNKHVGKLFLELDSFDEEVNAYTIVEKIDPARKWSLPLLDHCLTRLDATKYDEEIEKCPKLKRGRYSKKRPSLYGQVIMPYGGRPLDKVITEKRPSLQQFVGIMMTVLEAINDLDSQGYAHLDVKPSNILVADDGRVSLIDYSLLQKQQSIYDMDHNRHLFVEKYIWYPPEFYVFNKLNQILPNLTESLTNSDVNYIASRALYIYHVDKYGIKKSNTLYKSQLQSMTTFVSDISHACQDSKTHPGAMFGKLTSKVDIYSAGVVFLNIFEKCRYRASNKLYTPVLGLLHTMIESDPRNRIAPHLALSSLRNIHMG